MLFPAWTPAPPDSRSTTQLQTELVAAATDLVAQCVPGVGAKNGSQEHRSDGRGGAGVLIGSAHRFDALVCICVPAELPHRLLPSVARFRSESPKGGRHEGLVSSLDTEPAEAASPEGCRAMPCLRDRAAAGLCRGGIGLTEAEVPPRNAVVVLDAGPHDGPIHAEHLPVDRE